VSVRSKLAARGPVVIPARYPYPAATRRERGPVLAIWLARLLVAGAVLTSLIGALVYYNRLVSLEQEINAARAQIDRELQRRNDLLQNLVPPVFEYADLERRVFTEVAKVRGELPGGLKDLLPSALDGQSLGSAPSGLTAGADKLGEIMGRLIAISEQYPDMKASAPFELLMQKITETEDRLATERQRYNVLVNQYVTLACSFPGAVFATLFRFEKHKPFFAVEPAASPTPKVRRPPPQAQQP